MRLKFHRVILAVAGLLGTFAALDHIEKQRATETPSEWKRIDGKPLPIEDGPPRVANSVWRLGPSTLWQSNTQADQLYLRPKLMGTLGVSISARERQGLWIWLHTDQAVTAELSGSEILCMGHIQPPDTIEPVELKKQADGVLVRWGEQRMVCPADTTEGHPAIQTAQTAAHLVSIGRDRLSDGVPISPLWWMSGLMVGGLLAMITLDMLLALFGRLRPSPRLPEEE